MIITNMLIPVKLIIPLLNGSLYLNHALHIIQTPNSLYHNCVAHFLTCKNLSFHEFLTLRISNFLTKSVDDDNEDVRRLLLHRTGEA